MATGVTVRNKSAFPIGSQATTTKMVKLVNIFLAHNHK